MKEAVEQLKLHGEASLRDLEDTRETIGVADRLHSSLVAQTKQQLERKIELVSAKVSDLAKNLDTFKATVGQRFEESKQGLQDYVQNELQKVNVRKIEIDIKNLKSQ